MKKYLSILICAVFCALLMTTAVFAFGNNDKNDGGMMNGIRDAVTDAGDLVKDEITDIKDSADSMLDPENGKPEAEGDGIVDDDKDDGKKDTETDKSTTDRDTSGNADSSRDTTDRADETTGVIDGMELEEKGINPWAIVIAVAVVIVVLVLIFILIPKRRR